MKRLTLIGVLVMAVLFGFWSFGAAAPVKQSGQTKAVVLNNFNTINAGETKSWGPVKEGDCIKIYFKPRQGQRFSACVTTDFIEAKDFNKFKFESGTTFQGPRVRSGAYVIICTNLYAAKDINGPWRWLQCGVDGYAGFALETEKEIGFAPEVYMFEVRCYQVVIGINCHTSGFKPAFTLDVKPIPQNNVRTLEVKAPSGTTEYFALSANKLVKTVNDTGYKLNLSCAKALVDSTKIFANCAKNEPDLAGNADLVLKQTGLVDSYLAANWKRIMSFGAKESLWAAETDAIRAKLAQSVEPLTRTEKQLAAAEKMATAKPVTTNEGKE